MVCCFNFTLWKRCNYYQAFLFIELAQCVIVQDKMSIFTPRKFCLFHYYYNYYKKNIYLTKILYYKLILSIQKEKKHSIYISFNKFISSSTAAPSFLTQKKTTECQIHGAGKFKKKANFFSTKSAGILHV